MWFMIAWLVLGLIGGLAALTLGNSRATPQNQQGYKVPTTELGTPLGVLFGKRRIPQAKIAWWGHVRIIKRKLNTMGKK